MKSSSTADLKTWAAGEFKPFAEDDCAALLDRLKQPDWTELGMSLRLAVALAGKTKDELVDHVRRERHAFMDFHEAFDSDIDLLRALIRVCETVRARVLIAASTVALESGPAKVAKLRPPRSKRP